jgi:myosin-5
LEKTRITHQVEGERNYHIFYQLLSGADEALLKELGLDGGSTDFFYLGCRDAIATEKDSNDFLETKKCLTSIGLSEDEQTTVFGMAAAVLHLGNIQFEPKEEDHEIARITNDTMASLKKACDLLGFSDKLLSEAILTKTIIVSGKSIKQQQSVALAEDKRDALAKMTYGSLFRWLVSRVNESLKEQSDGKQKPMEMDDHGFIGVLDIYGFECFNVNGFEQLLINYCNEKLQRHFNRHIFEVEQQLYAVEGVDWSYITFNDNRPCLELIEGGSGIVGILNTLDDAWGGIGPASEKDSKFVIQLQSLFGSSGKSSNLTDVSESSFTYTAGHENFRSPTRARDRQFAILHYAGEVRRSHNVYSCRL